MTLDLLVVATRPLDPDRAPQRDAMRIATLTVMSVVRTQDVAATAGRTLPTVATATPENLRTVAITMVILKLSV